MSTRIRVGIIVLIIGAVLFAAWRAGLFALEDREQLAAAIERARDVPFVPVIFVVTYAIAAGAGLPATPFTLAGGALFGIGWGIPLNWLAEMLAASIAFGATRATGLRAAATAADFLENSNAPTGAAGVAAKQFSGRGAVYNLFRLRLVPVAPFALLNAGAALSGMRWRNYLVATGIGIIPITVIYTISASELVAGVAGSGARALMLALVSAAVLIGLTFIPALLRAFNRKVS